MPFSSGTFSVVYNWTTESGAPPIEIAKLDTQHADFATGLSNCILRDGSGLPTAAIPWNSQNLTGVAQLEAQRFVPTGSTVPSNGMYLPAANTVAFASNTTLRGSVNAAGNWTIAAPSSGTAVTVNSFAGGTALSLVTASNDTIAVLSSTGGSGRDYALRSNNSTGNFVLRDNTAAADRITVAAAGNVTIAAPSSGIALTTTGLTGAVTARFENANAQNTEVAIVAAGTKEWRFLADTSAAFHIRDHTAAANRVTIASAGNVTINAPSSGVALTTSGSLNEIRATDGTTSWFAVTTSSVAYTGTRSNHPLNIRTNDTDRLVVSSAGNVTINAPSSGSALAVTSAPGGGPAVAAIGSSGVAGYVRLQDGQAGTRQWALTSGTVSAGRFSIFDETAAASRFEINTAGNVTINAPSSGTALTVTGVAGGAGAIINGSVHTPPVAVTFSATAMTVNCTLSNVFTTTFTANVTTAPTLSNPQDGQTINWFITQDATGGRTMTWPSTFRWPGGVAGVLSTAANAVDLMVATYRSGPNAWYASLSKGFA